MTKIKLLTLGGVIGALLFLSYSLWQAAAERKWKGSPEFALQQIRGVKVYTDLNLKTDFMTDKGRMVLENLVSNKQGPKGYTGLQTGDAQICGTLCFFPFSISDQGLAGRLQFCNDGKWKFDDVIFTKIDGHDVNDISLAYVTRHPDAWPHDEADWGRVIDIAINVVDILLRIRGR